MTDLFSYPAQSKSGWYNIVRNRDGAVIRGSVHLRYDKELKQTVFRCELLNDEGRLLKHLTADHLDNLSEDIAQVVGG